MVYLLIPWRFSMSIAQILLYSLIGIAALVSCPV